MPASTPILLLGAGGHARACIDVIEQGRQFKVGGLMGLPQEIGLQVLGYPVLGTDEDMPALLDRYTHALVAVGQIKTPDLRIRLFALLEQSNCEIPAIVSPHAYVSPHAAVGAGTIVMHGTIINAGAVVGRNCIINSQALIEHDAVIEDHCHVATAAVINGGVRVGAGTFIGSNSCVKQCVDIGERCLIGMGQNVIADCKKGASIPASKEPT